MSKLLNFIFGLIRKGNHISENVSGQLQHWQQGLHLRGRLFCGMLRVWRRPKCDPHQESRRVHLPMQGCCICWYDETPLAFKGFDNWIHLDDKWNKIDITNFGWQFVIPCFHCHILLLFFTCFFPLQLFHTYGTCDYLLFYKSGPNQNCHLFYGAESLVLEVGLHTIQLWNLQTAGLSADLRKVWAAPLQHQQWLLLRSTGSDLHLFLVDQFESQFFGHYH